MHNLAFKISSCFSQINYNLCRYIYAYKNYKLNKSKYII